MLMLPMTTLLDAMLLDAMLLMKMLLDATLLDKKLATAKSKYLKKVINRAAGERN